MSVTKNISLNFKNGSYTVSEPNKTKTLEQGQLEQKISKYLSDNSILPSPFYSTIDNGGFISTYIPTTTGINPGTGIYPYSITTPNTGILNLPQPQRQILSTDKDILINFHKGLSPVEMSFINHIITTLLQLDTEGRNDLYYIAVETYMKIRKTAEDNIKQNP